MAILETSRQMAGPVNVQSSILHGTCDHLFILQPSFHHLNSIDIFSITIRCQFNRNKCSITHLDGSISKDRLQGRRISLAVQAMRPGEGDWSHGAAAPRIWTRKPTFLNTPDRVSRQRKSSQTPTHDSLGNHGIKLIYE